MQKTTTRTPIAEKGITTGMFDEYLGDFVTTTLTEKEVKQTGTVNGTDYCLTIRLTRWAGRTRPEQIVVLSRLFWECYPKMHERFGSVGDSITKIVLDIENKGYGIAWNSGKLVHLHDGWLEKNPEDYDCITHELAHVFQTTGWDGKTLEYEDYIERFADACRYLYAFENGRFNDTDWELNTVEGEPTREQSVRFLVWFDYFYSTAENDLLRSYVRVCREGKYPTADWKDAWAEIFRGTALEGRGIEDIYAEYTKSEFAALSAVRSDGESPLLAKYDVRRRAK